MTKKTKAPKAGYDAGYGKPPKQHQFKPGKSGNPNGRPKGSPSLDGLFIREAGRLVKVETADGIQSFSKAQVIIRKLINNASNGDLKAAALVLSHLGRIRNEQEAVEAAPTFASFKIPDEEAISRMLARFTHLQAPAETKK